MSTYEEVSELKCQPVPRGYVVKFHERRGYDSPDRWWSASTKRGRKIGEYATSDEAIAACRADERKKRKKR